MGVLAEVADAERIYLVVSEVFFHPIVTGVLLTAVIAAVMSTADSQLLLASAVATDDLPLLRRISNAISANSRIWMGRLLLVIIGGIAAAVSILNPESVFELVSYAWGGMGAALGPSTIPGAVLAQIQLLGSYRINRHRHGGRLDLGLP